MAILIASQEGTVLYIMLGCFLLVALVAGGVFNWSAWQDAKKNGSDYDEVASRFFFYLFTVSVAALVVRELVLWLA